MSDKDRANLLGIIDSCNKIKSFTANIADPDAFYEDQKTFDAVLMNFVVVGEAVSRLTQKTKDQYASIPWKQIKTFRNIVAHEYFGVDAEEVWQIIHTHLPALQKDIEKLLFK